MLPELGPTTDEALARSVRRGGRAVEMLVAARAQLEAGGVRAGEKTCYCCREAFRSVLDSADDESMSIRVAGQAVVDARALSADPGSGTPLAAAIDDLEAALLAAREQNQRLLESVITEQAGMRPLRYRTDLFEAASRLIGALNTGLHNQIEVPGAAALYTETIQVFEVLFAPMSERLTDVDSLASKRSPGAADVEALELLGSDPRVLNYFFRSVTGSGWFEALKNHALLRPSVESRIWHASEYLWSVAADDPQAIVSWIDEELRRTDCTSVEATAMVRLAVEIGALGKSVVIRALHCFPGDREVATEASRFANSLQPDELDGPALRIVELSLSSMDG